MKALISQMNQEKLDTELLKLRMIICNLMLLTLCFGLVVAMKFWQTNFGMTQVMRQSNHFHKTLQDRLCATNLANLPFKNMCI